MLNRRQFIDRGTLGVVASTIMGAWPLLAKDSPGKNQMKLDLTFPKLGMRCDQRHAIELAAELSFQSVGVDTEQVAAMSEADLDKLNAFRESKGLIWGIAGCPVDFRRDDATFAAGLKDFAVIAPRLSRLGIAGMTTWISPANSELTYLKNFALHVERMKRLEEILAENNLRLGLEYVGTQLARFNRKHPFIHTSAEVLELIEATGARHLGLVVDSWHWWTSGETADDLRKLAGSQIVSVELNDAPRNLPREQQIDNQRRLPASTGVIPMKDFLTAIASTGYAGPAYAEPFYAPLREQSVDVAAEQVATAVKSAFALVS